eukprot:5048190-Prymnesium_polylepis.1
MRTCAQPPLTIIGVPVAHWCEHLRITCVGRATAGRHQRRRFQRRHPIHLLPPGAHRCRVRQLIRVQDDLWRKPGGRIRGDSLVPRVWTLLS